MATTTSSPVRLAPDGTLTAVPFVSVQRVVNVAMEIPANESVTAERSITIGASGSILIRAGAALGVR